MDRHDISQYVYDEEFVPIALEALAMPSDYIAGSDDEGVDWGRTGFSTHRDDDIYGRSNFRVACKDLEADYPDDFRVQGASHWAVGWVDELLVRILKPGVELDYGDVLAEGDITEAFKAAMKLQSELVDYPILDESDYSELEYEETINNLKSAFDGWGNLPGGVDWPEDKNKQDVAEEVYSWLSDCDIYPEEEDFLAKDVALACFDLGYVDMEDIDDWIEELEKVAPEYIAELIEWDRAAKREAFEAWNPPLFQEA